MFMMYLCPEVCLIGKQTRVNETADNDQEVENVSCSFHRFNVNIKIINYERNCGFIYFPN